MVKLNKIYTRTGDDGTTGLVDGSRRAKHDARMEAIGAVDEANSAIGVAVVALTATDHAAVLTRMQNDLFDLGADLGRAGLALRKCAGLGPMDLPLPTTCVQADCPLVFPSGGA